MSSQLDVCREPTVCAQCPIRERALFQVVSDRYINQAQSHRTAQYCLPARSYLYEEGEPALMAYTLFSGWVMLYRSHSDGGRQGIRLALPGDFIGYMPLGGETLDHSAVAITPAILCGFRQQDLHQMLHENLDMATQISRIQSRYLSSCQSQLLGLGRKSAEQRIAYLIAELYFRLKNRGLIENDSLQFEFPVTQEMLGDMTGLTPVHTNRVMRKLRVDGVFSVERQRLTVHELPRLMAIGEFSDTAVE